MQGKAISMCIRTQLSEFTEKLNKYINQHVQLWNNYFMMQSLISHPMEAVGTTKKLLYELVIGQFGNVGCSHS